MAFTKFVEIYMEDMKPRLKLNTYLTKQHIIDSKIIPYFEKIKAWQILVPQILFSGKISC